VESDPHGLHPGRHKQGGGVIFEAEQRVQIDCEDLNQKTVGPRDFENFPVRSRRLGDLDTSLAATGNRIGHAAGSKKSFPCICLPQTSR
jgi:hypothetical protein